MGRLLFATSWSPSFNSGMTSASFQIVGKTDIKREQLTISVIVGRIHGRASFITFIVTLYGPGALFDGKECMILHIVVEDTVKKLNSSIWGITTVGGVCKRRPFSVTILLRCLCHASSHWSEEFVTFFGEDPVISSVNRLSYLFTWNTVPNCFPHWVPLLLLISLQSLFVDVKADAVKCTFTDRHSALDVFVMHYSAF